MKRDAFRRRCAAAFKEAMPRLIALARERNPKALRFLVKVRDDERAPAGLRLEAAEAVRELGVESKPREPNPRASKETAELAAVIDRARALIADETAAPALRLDAVKVLTEVALGPPKPLEPIGAKRKALHK